MIRQSVDSAYPAREQTYGQLAHMAMLWDLSKRPASNCDRIGKLGKFASTRAVAVADFDPATHMTLLCDGLGNPSQKVTSVRPYEPDNWVLRFHESKGVGPDSVWAIRMICDHSNSSGAITHRSTIVIDQCSQQNWAFIHDALWVKRVLGAAQSPKIGPQELQFNGAGFLPMLSRDMPVKSDSRRAACMVNVSKSGGQISDGRLAGQLWHVLHMQERWRAKPQKFQTTALSPAITEPKCGEATEMFACLRGDALFMFRDMPAFIEIFDTNGIPAGDQYFGGLYIHRIGDTLADTGPSVPMPPSQEMMLDGTSDHPTMTSRRDQALALGNGIRPWIKVPAIVQTDTPYQQSGGVPLSGGFGGNTAPPVRTGSERFLPTFNTEINYRVPMPEEIFGRSLFCVFAWKAPLVDASPAVVSLSIAYSLHRSPDTVAPGWTFVTKNLNLHRVNPIDPDEADLVKRAVFKIDASVIEDHDGGWMSVSLLRSSTDTYPNGWDLEEARYVFTTQNVTEDAADFVPAIIVPFRP